MQKSIEDIIPSWMLTDGPIDYEYWLYKLYDHCQRLSIGVNAHTANLHQVYYEVNLNNLFFNSFAAQYEFYTDFYQTMQNQSSADQQTLDLNLVFPNELKHLDQSLNQSVNAGDLEQPLVTTYFSREFEPIVYQLTPEAFTEFQQVHTELVNKFQELRQKLSLSAISNSGFRPNSGGLVVIVTPNQKALYSFPAPVYYSRDDLSEFELKFEAQLTDTTSQQIEQLKTQYPGYSLYKAYVTDASISTALNSVLANMLYFEAHKNYAL